MFEALICRCLARHGTAGGESGGSAAGARSTLGAPLTLRQGGREGRKETNMGGGEVCSDDFVADAKLKIC